MKRILFYVLCLAISITACTNDEGLVYDTENVSNKKGNVNFHITQEQAMSTLTNLLKYEDTTRSSQFRIKNIKPIVSSPMTRSSVEGLSDTCLYVINFEDNAGFAVMSADKRTEPIFALLDNGNYENGQAEDSIYKPIINASINYTTREVILYNRIGNETTIGEEDPSGKYTLDSNCIRRLKKYLWDGGAPFNDYCPIIDKSKDVHALAGCAAVTLSTIISYFKIDPKISGFTLNHDLIPYTFSEANENQEKADMVGQLFYKVGTAIKADYNKNGRASEDNIWNYLRTLDIPYKTGFKDFNNKDAAANIYTALRTSKKGLVIMKGTNSEGLGHMWLLDGLKKYKVNASIGTSLYLYHCVWGWCGKFDGFFLQHIVGDMGFQLFSYKMYNDIDVDRIHKDMDLVYCNNLRYCALSQKLIADAGL